MSLDDKLKEIEKIAHNRRSGEMLNLLAALKKCREQREEVIANNWPDTPSSLTGAYDVELLAILDTSHKA